MKSVLRNRSLAVTALATIALSLSACSGAEDAESVTSDSANIDDGQSVTTESAETSEPAGDETEQPAPEQLTGHTEQAQSSRDDQNAGQDSSDVETPAASASDETDAVEAVETPEATPAPVPSNTMRVSGNKLLDACGQPFVVRGVEQILGNQLPEGNDWLGLVREIAKTGANAVRILPGMGTLTLGDVDEILTFIGAQGMVAFIDPLNAGDWYAQYDVRAMLKKHERFLIIDAYGEPQYDDIEKWREEAKDALVRMRALGYEVPFTVYANQFGRALPSLFDYGAEILAADPLHNTFLGWQAYWGNTGYYQGFYGYTLEEAVDAIVASGLPIQMGLDHITDLPSTEADYTTLMRGAKENGIGWLWWDFYNPYGAENNLSEDGSAANLTSTGNIVLQSHAASIANTAKLACGR
jgi:hypothetical protein